jgi:hypothetical protein
MEETFVNGQEVRKAIGKITELKYMGDIESYLTDMETVHFMGYLVGTPWRTMLGDGLAEDLKYCL